MGISKKRIIQISILAAIAVLLSLASFSFYLWYRNPARFPSTASLMTDRPEFAAYAELFNAQQSRYRIQIVYQKHPAAAVQQGSKLGAECDLVAGPFLNSPDSLASFHSLKPLFQSEKRTESKDLSFPLLEKEAFYQNLLEMGEDSTGVQRLLPLSFNLPALIYQEKNRNAQKEVFSLNLESIQEESAAYNLEDDDSLEKMGFSPLWNPEVLYVKTGLFHTNFRSSADRKIVWEQDHLEKTIDFIREWIASVNGGFDMEQDFIDTFLYDPPVKLLSEGRILFSYFTLRDFFHLDPERRSSLDLRWMARNDSIPVADDVLYIGMLSGAEAKPAAEAFLLWLLSIDSQKKILESSSFKRLRTFGIAEGLSSLRAVNENVLPQYYPSLVGHIPPESYLDFPAALAPKWDLLKQEIIVPWLLEQSSRDQTPEEEELQGNIDRWYRQQASE